MGLARVMRQLSKPFRDDFYLIWEQAWGIGCTLRVTFKPDKLTDRSGQSATYIRVSSDLSWSSSGRTVAQATAATTLYTQVIQLAALIEAATDGMELVVEETKKEA